MVVFGKDKGEEKIICSWHWAFEIGFFLTLAPEVRSQNT